jgi:hypothetical protein
MCAVEEDLDFPLLHCRRIFLTGFRLSQCIDEAASDDFPLADAEIYVRVADSPSQGDDIDRVVDYNILRDSLIQAMPLDAMYMDRALDLLFRDTRVQLAGIRLSLDEQHHHLQQRARCAMRRRAA